MAKVKISELPSLSPATLDTTYVVGVSGSTTYKISINQLTSSLDTTFATDLVTAALSSSLNSKLSTSSFNTFTQSYYSTSASVDTRLDTLETFSSSADNRYVLSGSITQTTWDNIANKPNDIVSSSTQISNLGFVTGSYTTLNSFNNLTQSFNSISQSFTTISGSFGDIDFSGINAVTKSYLLFTQSYYSASASFDERIIAATNEQDLSYLATTGSNTFIGNQIISGSATISQGIHNWEFGSDGIIKLNNGYGEIYADADSGSVRIGTAGENVAPNAQIILGGPDNVFKIKSGPPLREWTFEGNGDFNLSGSINGSSNLVTTSSFNTFTQSYYSASASFDSRVTTEKNRIDAILSASNANTDTFAEVVSLINSVDLTNDNAFATFYTASNGRITSLENATSSYLTSLNGAISSSAQVLNGSGIFSSSAQLPTGLVSGSSQISTLGFITGSYISSSTYTTDSASFNERIISGSAVAGTISSSAQISGLGYATTSSVTIISASAWGAFQSASSYSSSLQTSIASLNIWSSSLSTIGALNADYIQVQKSADQTGVAKNTDITFNVVTATNSGITHSNGVFTLTAGKTYVLEASLCINTFSDAAAYLWWSWVDSTTDTQLDTSNGGVLATGASGVAIPTTWTTSDNYVGYAKLIYTPATNQTIKVRATDGGGTCKVLAIASKATITQINPSFATNALSTMQISGSLIATGSITTKGNINVGTGSGNEGGEIDLAYSQNTTLTGSNVAFDVYGDKIRIFENGGTNRGVSIDLSKAPASVGADLLWKTSGYVNAGTFVQLDNIKATVTTSSYRGLSLASVSGTFSAFINGTYTLYTGGVSGMGGSFSITTTPTTSLFNWSFSSQGDAVTYIINDTTNSRAYRITLVIGGSYNNNFISIERLY